VKIGPVDIEIALLIVKKEEITEDKIYFAILQLEYSLHVFLLKTPMTCFLKSDARRGSH